MENRRCELQLDHNIRTIIKTILVIILVELVYKFTGGNTVWMAAAANVGTTLSIFFSFTYLLDFTE